MAKLKLSKTNIKVLEREEKRLKALFEEARDEFKTRPGVTGKYAAYMLGKLHSVQDMLGLPLDHSHLNKD